MYRVFSAYIEIDTDDRNEAIKTARLNAAAVYDNESGRIIADYRTVDSENDDQG